jgi:hypothetical protein
MFKIISTNLSIYTNLDVLFIFILIKILRFTPFNILNAYFILFYNILNINIQQRITFMSFPYIPQDLLDIILQFDGRIKYRKGYFVNIIHKYDERYDIIKSIINKKIDILKNCRIDNNKFYFEFFFDKLDYRGLCYDYSYSFSDESRICYFDLRINMENIIPYNT